MLKAIALFATILSTACVEAGPATGIMGEVLAVDGRDGCNDEDGDPISFSVTVLEVGDPLQAVAAQAVGCQLSGPSAFALDVPPGSYTVAVRAYQTVEYFSDLEREQVWTVDVGDGEIIDFGLIRLDVNDDNEFGAR